MNVVIHMMNHNIGSVKDVRTTESKHPAPTLSYQVRVVEQSPQKGAVRHVVDTSHAPHAVEHPMILLQLRVHLMSKMTQKLQKHPVVHNLLEVLANIPEQGEPHKIRQ